MIQVHVCDQLGPGKTIESFEAKDAESLGQTEVGKRSKQLQNRLFCSLVLKYGTSDLSGH